MSPTSASARAATARSSQRTSDDPMAAWCDLFEGCTRIAELQPRMPATALGVIQRLRLVPGVSIEAVISDGTDRLRAVWTSGDSMPGLELGRGLRLKGTVSTDSGQAVMRNPTWCVVRDPYACADAPGDHPDRPGTLIGVGGPRPRRRA